ncbi:MAG: NTP transferase domain-containing protein [Pseudomonadota bacterium]
MKPQAITAIVLAAGYSSRMGAFKPLLRIGDKTVLERIIGLFREAGIGDVRVVAGHRAEEVIPRAEELGVRWILNEHFQDGMLSSVQAGVGSIGPDRDAFFLLPVDIPLVRTHTVLKLKAAYGECGKGIVYPTFVGKRGHPPLIAARYSEEILNWTGSGGLRSFLSRKESDAVNVAVPDEYIGLDMDTPADYETILKKWAAYDIPSVPECMEVLKERDAVSGKLIAHSRRVAQVALIIGQALNDRGSCLDPALIRAAGLLHDMARDRPRHASTGGRILRDMGFPRVAEIVEQHMSVEIRADRPVNERDVVALSDKLVMGDVVVSLEDRFQTRLDRYSNDPDIRAAVSERLTHARRLRARIEDALGTSIDTVFSNRPEVRREARDEDLSVEIGRD